MKSYSVCSLIVWLFLLSIAILRYGYSLCVCQWLISFVTEWCPIAWICHRLSSHLLMDIWGVSTF